MKMITAIKTLILSMIMVVGFGFSSFAADYCSVTTFCGAYCQVTAPEGGRVSCAGVIRATCCAYFPDGSIYYCITVPCDHVGLCI